MKEVRFYRTSDEYGCFSNFSKHPVVMNGLVWKTSEHYYQAQKFNDISNMYTKLTFEPDPSYEDFWDVFNTESPKEAALMGRDPRRKMRPDWGLVKNGIMTDVVTEKVKQHADVREKLLSTRNAIIIEDSPTDYYWGCGKDGTGLNWLGKILMIIRMIYYETGRSPKWLTDYTPS